MKRRLTALIVLLATALTMLAGATSASASARTTFSYVRPTTLNDGFIKHGYKIVATANNADCRQSSELIPGTDRCFAGDYVYDPCWYYTNSAHYYQGDVCLGTPWSHDLYRLKVKHVNHTIPVPGKVVWGVQLSNGQKCGLVGGAIDVYKGKPVDFVCSAHTSLVGMPTRGRTWYITRVVYSKKSYHIIRSKKYSVKHVWYGLSPVNHLG